MSKISFIKSDDRVYNVERCLSLLKSEIITGLKRAKRVVVKPNCIVEDIQLATTHVDALRAVLDFIRPFVKGQITLAEGSGIGDTLRAFKNYGYLALQDKYDLALVDLNNDDPVEIQLEDKDGQPLNLKIAKTIVDSDYIISVSPPKTHDSVNFTGAIKNIAVGSLLRPNGGISGLFHRQLNHKMAIHQGPKAINRNIANIFNKFNPGLAILDAYEIMEGDGPIHGEMVSAHCAIASTDFLAADWLAARLMGINLEDIGYLSLLGVLNDSDHFVVGDSWKQNRLAVKLHPRHDLNRHWRESLV